MQYLVSISGKNYLNYLYIYIVFAKVGPTEQWLLFTTKLKSLILQTAKVKFIFIYFVVMCNL